MALIEYDVYKQKLRELEPELDKLWSPKGGQPVIIHSKGGVQ